MKGQQSYIPLSETYRTYPKNNSEPGLFPGKIAVTIFSLKIECKEETLRSFTLLNPQKSIILWLSLQFLVNVMIISLCVFNAFILALKFF